MTPDLSRMQRWIVQLGFIFTVGPLVGYSIARLAVWMIGKGVG